MSVTQPKLLAICKRLLERHQRDSKALLEENDQNGVRLTAGEVLALYEAVEACEG